MKTAFDVCVLPGDGIGVDVIEATLPLLDLRGTAGTRELRDAVLSNL